MEEDLFSLAAGKQPSQQATNETASRLGERGKTPAPATPETRKKPLPAA